MLARLLSFTFCWYCHTQRMLERHPFSCHYLHSKTLTLHLLLDFTNLCFLQDISIVVVECILYRKPMLKNKTDFDQLFSLSGKVEQQADSHQTVVHFLYFMMPVWQIQSFGNKTSNGMQFWLVCSLFNLAANSWQSLMLNEQLHWSQWLALKLPCHKRSVLCCPR